MWLFYFHLILSNDLFYGSENKIAIFAPMFMKKETQIFMKVQFQNKMTEILRKKKHLILSIDTICLYYFFFWVYFVKLV